MSKRILTSFALVFVLAAAAFAQAGGTGWVSVAPEGEEFVVRMPATPLMVARHLTVGGEASLVPTSYEAAGGKVRYSVLSFGKVGQGPQTLDALIEIFRQALLGAQSGDYVIEHERDLTLDGRAGKQFSLRTGKPLGTVQIYDGRDHFYVLMAFGGRAGEPAADQFFSSFSLAPQSRAAAQTLKLNYAREADAPASFWPAVSVTKSVGVVIGTRDDAGAGPTNRRAVSGGVLNGKVVSSVAPSYPSIARAARASGTVVVQVILDEEGRVVSARAVSGHPLLQQSAVNAVRQWRFEPIILDGQPVKVSGTVNVNFVLQ